MRILSAMFVMAIAVNFVPAASAEEPEFQVGQRVSFEDLTNTYGGGTVTGTIVEDIGRYDRYRVKVDVKVNPAFQIQGFPGSRLHALGPAPSTPISSQPAPAPTGQAPYQQPQIQQPPAGRPTAGHPGQRISTGGGANYSPLGRWKTFSPGNNPNFPLGKDGAMVPGREDFKVTSSPGDAFPIGRWALMVGGVWTNKGGPDRDGNQLQEFGGPEKAEKVAINADGTWTRSAMGTAPAASGKWVDIGYNVVRLLDYYAPGQDFTASVWQGKLTLKMGGGGTSYEGKPY